MNRVLLASALLLCLATIGHTQANCVEGGTYTDAQGGIMYCTGLGTAIKMAKYSDAGGIPVGLIALSLTTCPTGWAEASALNGVMLRGTVAANGNVGTPGGADARTPAGTIAYPAAVPTFTGAALAVHAHELPFQLPLTTTTRQIAGATFGSGTSRPSTAISATGTANTGSSPVALSQAVSGGTPAGTIAWPSGAPTFTGIAFDNRPAYLNVIFCAKQ